MSYLLNKLEQEYSHLLRDELEGASLLKRIRVLENKIEKLEKEIQQNNLFNVAHCSSAYASAFNSAAHTHYNPYSMGALQQAMGNAEYRAQMVIISRQAYENLFGRIF